MDIPENLLEIESKLQSKIRHPSLRPPFAIAQQ
jgi:hypothetical protein